MSAARSPLRVGLRMAEPGDLAAIEALQHEAYAPNRDILGVEPLPLQADYSAIMRDHVIWLAETSEEPAPRLAGALVIAPQDDSLLIWSVAAAPFAQGQGVGGQLLHLAERIAKMSGLAELTLYTGDKLSQNIAWYARHGFVETGRETLEDRVIVHMHKALDIAAGAP